MTYTGDQRMNKQSGRYHASHAQGFTLIELLIVMVVIAMLTAIAIPSYRNQVAKTNRAAAKACMSQYAQFMERRYTTQMNYDTGGAPGLMGCATDGDLGARYTFTVNPMTPSTYTINATPIGAQLARETRCGTLTLDQTGTRGAGTGSAADVAYCW